MYTPKTRCVHWETGSGCGRHVNDKLCVLLFADDIVLIADSEEELQVLLKVVQGYCFKWKFEVNQVKTEVVVYGTERKDFDFVFGETKLKVAEYYKYLGMEIGKRNSVKKWKTR